MWAIPDPKDAKERSRLIEQWKSENGEILT